MPSRRNRVACRVAPRGGWTGHLPKAIRNCPALCRLCLGTRTEKSRQSQNTSWFEHQPAEPMVHGIALTGLKAVPRGRRRNFDEKGRVVEARAQSRPRLHGMSGLFQRMRAKWI